MLVTRPPRPVKTKISSNKNNTIRANRSSTGSTSSICSNKSNNVNSLLTSTTNIPRSSVKNLDSLVKKDEDFYKFRPSFHLIAPKNWMNDPCGPCFDESTGLFHVLYQYNPKGAKWGNMSWLHATSKDLIHWKHISKESTLQPKVSHDLEGVFSGSMINLGPKGEKGILTIFYTAVSKLPIHWTKDYQWGCEKLAIACSSDGGKTWKREEDYSILLDSPPKEFQDEIISWRDPFISSWPEMDIKLGYPPQTYIYGLISGGLRDKTPTAFLYKIEKNDLTKWSFVSTIAEVGLDFKLQDSKIGMGRNWEVCNFFNLQSSSKEEESKQFLLMNVEGVGKDFKSRYPMWAQCSFLSDSPGRLQPIKNGILDHGSLYAATTFYHQPTSRRILWGWITEDDLAEHRYDQQGWSGCISLPREIFTLEFEGVDPIMLQNDQIKSTFEFNQSNVEKSMKMTTLGCKPAEETLSLRQGAKHIQIIKPNLNSIEQLQIQSRNYELSFDIIFNDWKKAKQQEIGIVLCHDDQDVEKGIKIVFIDEHIQILRKGTTNDPDVNTESIKVPFSILQFSNGSTENLHFQLFLDNSVLELFINNRLCITSRIYCEDDQANQISFINNNNMDSNQTGFHYENFNLWTGLQKAMLDEITTTSVEGDELVNVSASASASDSVAHL